MKKREILAKEWIAKAQSDLKTAQILFTEKGPSDTLCFHCQQTVEKYLKAYLAFQGIHFEKIHDLRVLAKLCAEKDESFLKFMPEFKILDAYYYYIETRYPPSPTSYTRQECQEALEIAKDFIKFVKEKMAQ